MEHVRGVPYFGDLLDLNIKTGKGVSILLMLVFTSSFVLASVTVHNYSVVTSYSPFDNLMGEMNLTIEGEDYGELISSNDRGNMGLGDFLRASGNDFDCSPADCLSSGYVPAAGASEGNLNIVPFESVYNGFVLTGNAIDVDELSFKIESDFGVGAQVPLSIKFFEDEVWKYEGFSEQFLEKDWGCYNPDIGSAGASIGEAKYCEMINIADTSRLRVGVVVSGSDELDLKMSVHPDTGFGGEWSCEYNVSEVDYCDVSMEAGEIFSSGNYQVCVSAEDFTGYQIHNESEGDNCGFAFAQDPGTSTKDYAIFAQGLKYGNANALSSIDFNDEDIVDAANNLITNKYNGDCSSGCVLPMEFSGVAQNARIYDARLKYTRDYESYAESDFHDLEIVPVTIDFSGVVDLGALDFGVSGAMKYILSLGNIELFSEEMDISPAPIILSIFPDDPPAGVPIKFVAVVNFSGNKTLTYNWDFGDNDSEKTDENNVMHTYEELGNHTMTLEVSAGGNLTSVNTFDINVISPEKAVKDSLIFKRNALNFIMDELANLPAWFSGPLGKLINVDSFEAELDILDKKRTSADAEDFIEIAKVLYDLDVPSAITFERYDSPYLLAKLSNVDIEPVEIMGGKVSGSTDELYAKYILNWQALNIAGNFVSNIYSVSTYSGESERILTTYSFNVKSEADEKSYFVINRPKSELFFKDGVSPKKAGDATVIILDPREDVSFEFYYEGSEMTTHFVSPKLSSIVLEEDIDVNCNYNSVCEPDSGENSKTCRTDCKPVGRMYLYIVLAIVLVFFLYLVLQVWYKRRYEGFLFKDKRQAYNLLMYVTNARARGLKDNRTAAELRKQGWSSERVKYIIKKSKGKRTGMFEIIPIGKISAYFRNRAAKKRMTAVATEPQQQMKRNINKSEFQGRV